MKKISIVIFLFLVPFIIFAQSGRITELTGTVEIKPATSDNYVPARVGSVINADTVIYTGLRSTAVVEVGSTVINVRPLTRLTLSEISASNNTEEVNVNLQTGRLRVDVNPPAGTRSYTTVVSPSATASVRGTTFQIDTRTLMVEHGSVSYQGNRGYAVTANAGSVSYVSGNGTAAAPVVVQTSAGIESDMNTGSLDAVLGPGFDSNLLKQTETEKNQREARKNTNRIYQTVMAFVYLIGAPFK